MIPYGRQDINQADIEAVIEVLKSDFLTQGPMVPMFEKAIADYCQARFGMATNSATSALHIACLALELGPGDYLWTSPNTFVASANCGLYCGAEVDFVDIDPRTYCMSADALEQKLIEADKQNKLPKIVVPVHFAGQSCEMNRIHQLAKKYDFRIIEDASHAIGGKYLGEPIGNCKYSDIAVFSFHPVKIITTGEGGLATTNDAALAKKMELLRSHGITRDPELMTRKPDGGWYYQQIDLGFNYRMTDMQAALGMSQMQRLDEFVQYRHVLKNHYNELLSDLPIIRPYQSTGSHSALHLYPIQLELEKLNKSHHEIFHELRESGLGVNIHYIPVHTQPYYQRMGFQLGDFPNAERYYQRAISIPLYPSMTDAEQDLVLKIMNEIIK
ncbi:UDP-4-amino-4,6-dideoxy-N-acetyl-beta-L-altrosamine transaminase [Methylophaga nitratireducenticrescens]|uniref:UDP-4-amino-4, 6-dideoxy-N-acetyl-beta-L-altrosamine transaminase n=1 Tax=Methylophaga nitratireducenticrescens TaxID=754476 RepID=UPI000CDBF2EF|nr:UDP-4-amino-4,6-dideoxy-N-acetyl-beta-L-altrosamine transaminase [Methylophaga nitratireducenticrescens]AUZ84039.1 UDP-4-amino-4,6-dideoxy-N-acetyl-beta-L-altrosamine transaminase [Methylophaga nitratireducenticrescens]